MSRLKRLIAEVHRRSIWQVLAIYLLGAAACYQVIQSLTEGLELPDWLPGFAVVLFIALLPVVLATAVVREDASPRKRARPLEAEAGVLEPEAVAARPGAAAGYRVLYWRRALLGLMGVFALWGVVAAGWVFLGGTVLGSASDTELPSLETKLAVLPFENLGPAEDEYFADGVTEEITSRLAELPGLGVISRTSAITYKDTDKNTPAIAEELDVDYILEGTVRWDRGPDGSSRVRVTPQLVRVSDDTNIWTERYDAVLSDIFSVQSDIAENVARQLDIRLLEPQRQALGAKPTEILAAYDFYLRGNDYYGRRFAEDDARTTVEMYERAVELDPGFAAAWAALSRARVWLVHQFGRTSELHKARAAVDEALQLAPDLAEAHMALGDYQYYGRRDYEKALEEYVTVQRRQPGNSDAIALIAWIQRREAKWERSIANADRALELDPRNTVWVIGQAQNYFYLRSYAEAEPYFLRAISLAPDVPYYYRWAAWFYLAWDGTTERAHWLLQEASTRINPGVLLVGSEASWVILDVFGQDYTAALERLDLSSPGVDSTYYYLARAHVNSSAGQADLARTYYDSARVVLEAQVQEAPGMFAPHSALGIAYAGLDRVEDAIREGQRGVEMLPVSRDAMTGPDRVRDLARIYVMVGEHEAAIDQLEYLLYIPSQMSVNLLRADPFWAPLRDHPRFQALREK